jgi:hypothetical protein
MEGEFLPPEENFQAITELSPENFAEDLCWQEETDGLGPDPAVLVGTARLLVVVRRVCGDCNSVGRGGRLRDGVLFGGPTTPGDRHPDGRGAARIAVRSLPNGSQASAARGPNRRLALFFVYTESPTRGAVRRTPSLPVT